MALIVCRRPTPPISDEGSIAKRLEKRGVAALVLSGPHVAEPAFPWRKWPLIALLKPTRRRKPEKELPYQVIADNLETFLTCLRAEGHDVPGYVVEEFYRYPDCGILARGLARCSCEMCGKSLAVGLSCKCRGFCPSAAFWFECEYQFTRTKRDLFKSIPRIFSLHRI